MGIRIRDGRLAYVLGPGLFSAAAGFEVSNLGVFALAGMRYGTRMLWAVVLSLMMASAMQQMAALVGLRLRGRSLLAEIRGRSRSLYLASAWSLYTASMATASMNMAGLAVFLSSFLGIGWRQALGLVALTLWSLTYSARSYRRVEGILLTLSMMLLAFVAAAARSPYTLHDVLEGLRIGGVEGPGDALFVVAVFGAAAAPYSLVLQAEGMDAGTASGGGEEMINVGVGMLFSLILGASIVVASPLMAGGCGNPACIVGRAGSDALSASLIMVGLMASGLLAVMATILVSSSPTSPVPRIIGTPRYFGASGFVLGSSYIISMIMLDAWSLPRIIESASIVVSMTAWVPGLAVYSLYREEAGKTAALLEGIVVAASALVNLFLLLPLSS